MTQKTKEPDYLVDEDTVQLIASLRRGGPAHLLESLIQTIQSFPKDKVQIDLSRQNTIDSLGVTLLSELVVQAHMINKEITFQGLNDQVARGMKRYYFPAPELIIPEEKRLYAESLGAGVISLREAAGEMLMLTSEAIYWSFVTIWRGDGHRKGAIESQALLIGVGSLPVIATISFLVGLILALQSAEQLRQFGANIFVADLVAISMTREMGPLMTAILLAGRSGAAIAAEIASMTVNEEIDALRTMGLNPIRYVVVPKVWGILLTAPLLAIMATVIGIMGGFIIAVSALDLTPQAFIQEVAGALYLLDIISGIVKSICFALIIVIISSFFGFRVTGGPEGVGRATTSSVVAAIFSVIVADAILGILFYL